MERNIFENIQVPGAKRSDPDWYITCWGYKTLDDFFVDSDDEVKTGSENKVIPPSPTSEHLSIIANLECLQAYKKDPKQSKIDSFFTKKEKEYKIAPLKTKCNQCVPFDPNQPSTSNAYGECVHQRNLMQQLKEESDDAHVNAEQNAVGEQQLNASYADQYLCAEDDQMVIEQVENTEMRIKNHKRKMEEELFWNTVEKRNRNEHKQITHERNLARIEQADRLDYNRMKLKLEDKFHAIRTWPGFAVDLLLTPTFSYNERLTLATFFHGNGMIDGRRAVSYFQFYNAYWNRQTGDQRQWKQKIFKFEKLFAYLDKANDINDPEYHRLGSKYYYYNMIVKHMMYYNGEKRKNGKPSDFLEHTY